MRRVASIAAVFAVAALATSASPAATPEWQTHPLSQGGTIALPPTWRNLTRLTPQLQKALSREATRNPRVAPILFALTARVDRFVRFVGADLARSSLRSGFVTNLSILGQRTNASLDVWARTNVAALRRLSTVAKPVRQSSVLLPAGRAVRLSYVQRVQTGTPVKRAAITQYALARNGTIYLLTFTTRPTQVARYRSIFAQSARSLRLG